MSLEFPQLVDEKYMRTGIRYPPLSRSVALFGVRKDSCNLRPCFSDPSLSETPIQFWPQNLDDDCECMSTVYICEGESEHLATARVHVSDVIRSYDSVYKPPGAGAPPMTNRESRAILERIHSLTGTIRADSTLNIVDIYLYAREVSVPLPNTPSGLIGDTFEQMVLGDPRQHDCRIAGPVEDSIGRSRADALGQAWADTRVQQGVAVQRDEGLLEEALDYYDAALGLVPDHFHALVARGVALIELERYEESIESLGAALRISPTNKNAIKYIQLARDLASTNS